ARLLGHPRNSVEMLLVSAAQVGNELLDLRFRGSREIALHVQLPDRLAHAGIEGSDRTLPALTLLQLPVQLAAEEVERLIVESRPQDARHAVEIVDLEIALPHTDWRLAEQGAKSLDGIGLGDVELLAVRQSERGQELAPGKRRRLLLDLCEGAQVVGQ